MCTGMRRALCCLFVLLSALVMSGDLAPGTLTGVVRDPTGAVIPGAAVLIQHWALKDGHPRNAVNEPLIYADSNGGFTLQLPPGVYDVFVSFPGFSPRAHEARIEPSKQASLNFELPFSRFVQWIS
ncbi:MAG: carboxypeptidase regulatory-like domain-containing protein [Acidobacteriaceae bacterium]|nr:carboxypeptidase regulatory-like domain-containing protein [Acidobacteriaceae bacterium]MBV9779103.1 carboxypeptidase regulatory-like domain-containing protein [Acidobacteriaceae bacterium]